MKTNLLIFAAAALISAGVFVFLPPRALPDPARAPSKYIEQIECLGGEVKPHKVDALRTVLMHYDEIKKDYSLYQTVEAHVATLRKDDPARNREVRKKIIADAGRSAMVPMIKLLQRGKPHERLSAINVLGILDEPLSYPALVEATRDENPEVRLNAVTVIMKKKIEQGAGALYDILERPDPDPRVRGAALLALSKMGVGLSLSPFLGQFADDPDPRVRTVVMRVIGDLGAGELRPLLKKGLKDDSGEVRKAARRSLNYLEKAPGG